MNKKYTKEQIEYLKKIADKTDRTNKEITTMFNDKFNKNKSIASIVSLKSRYGIKSYTRKYTAEQLDYLRELAPGRTHKEIHKIFNKRFKEKRSLLSIKSIMHENHILLDGTGRYEKGNKPKNTAPVGTELKKADGYLYVKIGEPNKWRQKHYLVWEKHHGPIPKKHALLFADRDRENTNIDNLILISRHQLLILNKKGLIQDDKDLTKTAVNIAKIYEKISNRRSK